MPPRRKEWIAWRSSAPRRILLDDLESGMLSLDSEEMSADDAWNSYYSHLQEFSNVPFAQFRERLRDHRKQVSGKTQRRGWITWKGSTPRRILIEDLVTGMLPVDGTELSADEAWYTYYSRLEEFKNVPLEQFRERVSDHREQVNGDLGRAITEESYFLYDRRLHPRPTTNGRGEIIYDLHPAKLLLRDDVENNRHVGIRPSELQRTRREYHDFKRRIFKEHIYQEIKRIKFINWMELKREEGDPQVKRMALYE
jgi:hypothetical protein